MTLKQLFDMQRKLDEVIVAMADVNADGLEPADFLGDRLLALHVEVSELANATRCFKYWSSKAPEKKEVLLDEYADILHFFLSVGLALGFTSDEVETAYQIKHQINYDRQREGY
ncbi:dUTP diphosphatase [Anaerosolibacter sp.]|uniref:dUTP diphosphatase n=1 Tax=Anaerosolibacter sp. TaxID=1872527 RepID=UPI0039F104FA